MFQFALSIVLIISIAIVYKQIQYIQQKSLGYDKENLILVPLSDDLYDSRDTLKELVVQSANITRQHLLMTIRIISKGRRAI